MSRVVFKNKWNRGIYHLVSQDGDKVVMERPDGTTFCIPAPCLRESYIKQKDEKEEK